MKWTYNGQPYQGPEEDEYGFLYRITNLRDGTYYIGMKSFWSITNPKLSKKASLAAWSGKGRKPTRNRGLKKESNWKTYISSSTSMKLHIKDEGEEAFKWEIIDIYKDKVRLEVAEALAILGTFCDPLCRNRWLKLTIYKQNYCK